MVGMVLNHPSVLVWKYVHKSPLRPTLHTGEIVLLLCWEDSVGKITPSQNERRHKCGQVPSRFWHRLGGVHAPYVRACVHKLDADHVCCLLVDPPL